MTCDFGINLIISVQDHPEKPYDSERKKGRERKKVIDSAETTAMTMTTKTTTTQPKSNRWHYDDFYDGHIKETPSLI